MARDTALTRTSFLFKPSFRHTFNGVTFHVGTAKGLPPRSAAVCTRRRARPPLLAVRHDLPDRMAIEALIHESLHACFDEKLTEQQVTRAARDIARLLKRCGVTLRLAKRRGGGR